MIKKTISKELLTEVNESQKLNNFVKSLKIDFNKVPKDDKMHELLTKNIDTNTLGLFAPAITEMTLIVKGAWGTSGKGVLDIRYSYKHPDASNGYSLRIYTRDGKTWSTDYYI